MLALVGSAQKAPWFFSAVTIAIFCACAPPPLSPRAPPPSPLGDAQITGVTPQRVRHDSLLADLCLTASEPIFVPGRDFVCTIEGEPRGAMTPDEADAHRACCAPLFFVRREEELSVGLVLFDDKGAALSELTADATIDVIPAAYEVIPVSRASDGGAELGPILNFVSEQGCAVVSEWTITRPPAEGDGSPFVLSLSASGAVAILGGDPHAMRCSDGQSMAPGDSCSLASCLSIENDPGPVEGSIAIEANDDARVLSIHAEVVKTPLVDPSYGSQGAAFFAVRFDQPIPGGGLAVHADGSATIVLYDFQARTGFLGDVSPQGTVTTPSIVSGVSFETSLSCDARDRVLFSSAYNAVAHETTAEDDDADAYLSSGIEEQVRFFSTHPAAEAMVFLGTSELAMTDLDGQLMPGFPLSLRSVLSGFGGADGVSLLPTGTVAVFVRLDRSGDGEVDTVAIVRFLPDGTLDRETKPDGVLVIDEVAEGSASVFLPDAATAGPDGSLYVLLEKSNEELSPVVVARFLPDGNLDEGFGSLGLARFVLEEGHDHRGSDLAVREDGVLFVTGIIVSVSATIPTIENTFVLRASPAGVFSEALVGSVAEVSVLRPAVECRGSACYAIGTTAERIHLARLE